MALTAESASKSAGAGFDLGVLRNTVVAYMFGLALIGIIVYACAMA